MDNYVLSRNRAREYFLSYDLGKVLMHPGIHRVENNLTLEFLGAKTYINLENGNVSFRDGTGREWEADYSEALSVYDWACDGDSDAVASKEYCPVHALPGVLVAGNGLSMNNQKLADLIDKRPDQFCEACKMLGGREESCGDLGFQIPVFPNFDILLKFYFSDEEFPATLTVLWDKNSLKFVRYETLYYIAGVLYRRIRSLLD